ncbi:cytochrome c [Chitinasiproducens palmae]|uniref:Cytochrome c, mono-and diheme variants n=1 Tax=Chitinasiproducens palmae TaxID=1770053 RepID=A0A1H2PN37_9BURK|nr:cytochrome c [Chitinasiproducens palmae]SDV48081.1 Cytochrome c, mono-and diheme variants [Chitinasiproducens palmae]
MQRKTLFALSTGVLALAAALALLPGRFATTQVAHAEQGFGDAKQPPAPAGASEQVKRGEYLARMGDCVACHTVRGAKPYSGNYAIPSPFGTMFTPNLTPDNETGLGKWTKDDFYRAMHEGKGKDGEFLYPAFPYTSYTKMPREDVDAIYAYLRTLEPVHNPKRDNLMPFPFNIRLSLLGWNIMFFRKGEFQPDPKQSAEYNRGAYLVQGPGHCGMCHTPINPLGGATTSAAFSGGLIPIQDWFAPALNSDKRYGLGDWSVEEVSDFLITGVSNKGVAFGPMADVVHNSTQYMTPADARAMAVYLKAQPVLKPSPKPTQFEVSEEFGKQLEREGRALYAANCAVCHGAQGEGTLPHFPPLAKNGSIVMESAVNPVKMILHGGYPPVTKGNPQPYGMPPFAHSMTDREVAAVASYIRMSWGNGGEAVSPQQVNSLRTAPLD